MIYISLELVVSETSTHKGMKSPMVEDIPSKLLKEAVQQIVISLAVFNEERFHGMDIFKQQSLI